MSLNTTENISLREELISTAVKFLSNPNILKSPLEQKQKFLRSKGLTDDEIKKAFELGATMVGGLPAVASSELLMYRHSKQSCFKEVFLSLAAFGGIAYGIYWIYKKWLETLLFGARPKKKTVDERLTDLSKSLETSMTELKQEIVTVRSEVDRLSNLQSNNSLTRGQIDGLKSDIASVKGILLNRNQFPSLPIRAEPPSIPAWQLQSSAHLQAEGRAGPSDLDEAVRREGDKEIAERGGDVLRTGRGERSESGGSNSSEGDAVTKNSDSSLEIIA